MDHNEIVQHLRRFKIPVGTEKRMQDAVAEVLRNAGCTFGKEWQFSKADRIDFFVMASGVGIECKIDGGPTEVLAQLLRYADQPTVKSLILVTRRHGHQFDVEHLNHKPFSVIWVPGAL